MKFRIKRIFFRLLLGNSTPHGIALGVAIGSFIGVLPVYGLHTALVIIAAVIVRPANKFAILLGTNISLPPTVPFITWAGYEIGRLILWGRFGPLQWSDFKNISFKNIASHYEPLFLGSIILGVICSLIVYFIVFFAVKGIKERKRHAGRSRRKDKEI
ncbi:MAG: DUF2062 domain-containing protein [Candidatus Omnitrophota bacterium]